MMSGIIYGKLLKLLQIKMQQLVILLGCSFQDHSATISHTTTWQVTPRSGTNRLRREIFVEII